MQKFELGNFARTDTPMTEINTIDIVDLMKQTGANGFQPSATKYGTKIFLCKDGAVLPVKAIRIGNKAILPDNKLTGEHQTFALKQLIDKNKIYWGKSDNGYWLCFSKEGTFTPGVVSSYDDILKATGIPKEEMEKMGG